MPAYRIYAITTDNHINSPPEIVKYENDREAVERAKQLIDGKTLEIWDGGGWRAWDKF